MCPAVSIDGARAAPALAEFGDVLGDVRDGVAVGRGSKHARRRSAKLLLKGASFVASRAKLPMHEILVPPALARFQGLRVKRPRREAIPLPFASIVG